MSGAPEGSIVAWLCCDPLPPIPLGPKPEVTIGRGPPCDLVLPHPEVSRRHATIKVRGDRVVLDDELSANGCYVNGVRVEGLKELVPGDVVTIGPYEVEVRPKDAVEEEQGPFARLETTRGSKLDPLAAMTGTLEEVSLAELLQSLEFNQKSGTLAIEARGIKGELVVCAGEPVRARWDGDLYGQEAVLEMLTLVTGRFRFTASSVDGENRIGTSITGLLLEASRRADEGMGAAGDPDGEPTRPVRWTPQ